VVALCARDETYEKLLSNIGEIKARHAPVIAVADVEDREIAQYVDSVLRVPTVSPEVSPVVNAVVCQLLAYYVAEYRACPIDKPRNLAKSVTVE